MTNVEKLIRINQLPAVRGRLGAGKYGRRKDEIENVDAEINLMSNHELVAKICGWELGDESWWNILKDVFDELEDIEV